MTIVALIDLTGMPQTIVMTEFGLRLLMILLEVWHLKPMQCNRTRYNFMKASLRQHRRSRTRRRRIPRCRKWKRRLLRRAVKRNDTQLQLIEDQLQPASSWQERLCYPDSIQHLLGNSMWKRASAIDHAKQIGFALGISPPPFVEREMIELGCLATDTTNHMYSLTPAHDGYPLIIDSGASGCLSPVKDDFIAWEKTENCLPITGINSQAQVKGIGTVEWTLQDDNGKPRKLRARALYVPECKVKLLSPQSVFLEKKSGKFTVDHLKSVFQFPHTHHQLTFPHKVGGLPITLENSAFPSMEGMPIENQNAAQDANTNMTLAQKELLRHHCRLGHLNFRWIQRLLRPSQDRVEPSLLSAAHGASSCVPPVCAACQYGKQTRRPDGARIVQNRPSKEGALSQGDLIPGSCISVDQFESTTKGRRSHTFGKEPNEERFCGGTIYVDHASGYVFVRNQVSLRGSDTLKGKHAFEQFASDVGVDIRKYHGDNGIFKASDWINDCQNRPKPQKTDYSGSGAHHQNGIAERAIRTILGSARTMMLYSAMHWPEEHDMCLWPLAVDYACWIWNHTPKMNGNIAPIEVFTQSKLPDDILKSVRVWGCPAYVLHPKLQDGKKIPKWEPRSRRGKFMGFSPDHSLRIGNILNLNTGKITPQFHVVFDDWYSTIHVKQKNYDDAPLPPEWETLLKTSRIQLYDPVDYDVGEPPPELDDEWLTSDQVEKRRQMRSRLALPRQAPPRIAREMIEQDFADDTSQIEQSPMDNSPPASIETPTPSDMPASTETPTPSDIPASTQNENPVAPSPPTDAPISPTAHDPIAPRRNPRRQARDRRIPRYSGQEWGLFQDYVMAPMEAFIAKLELTPSINSVSQLWRQCSVLMALSTDNEGLLHGLSPLMFAAKANADDTPSYRDAMNGAERDGFIEAMKSEIHQLEQMKAWVIVNRPKGKKVLPSTWAFKRKRYPDGSVRKLKARFCARGDLQVEGVDFFDTYAPVVAWSTIRILLILAVSLGLATQQVDYTLAFVHAEIDDEIYLEMPLGFRQEGKVLLLKRSLYGLRQSPLNFFNRLKASLEARGFKQSQNDPCLFMTRTCICICYVDDCLFFARDMKTINQVTASLQDKSRGDSLLLNVEDDVAGFLGILMKKHEDNSIELLQTGLIDRIISVTGLQDSNATLTPADKAPLGTDKEGASCEESWSYASVVGMLMYLASNSRPDVAFAVHQCARFTHCPKRSHEVAIKRIVRYLKGTKERGMIIRPRSNKKLNCYADADFAGLWKSEDPMDPACAKSRTGYILTLGNTPLCWCSKLQTKIALSTMEAEYSALATAMKEVIPTRRLVEEIFTTWNIKRSDDDKKTIVFEDNRGCMTLANTKMPLSTPRTKHYAIELHWFRSHIGEQISVEPIDTKLQLADIFTKGLETTEYRNKRKPLMGW